MLLWACTLCKEKARAKTSPLGGTLRETELPGVKSCLPPESEHLRCVLFVQDTLSNLLLRECPFKVDGGNDLRKQHCFSGLIYIP